MNPSDNTDKPDTNSSDAGDDPAVNVIRNKINALYSDEPDATEEIIEAAEAGPKRSKHQEFMYKLTTSGRSLAEIQTEWHNYYAKLSDREKHEVWREFYSAHGKEPQPQNKKQSIDTQAEEKADSEKKSTDDTDKSTDNVEEKKDTKKEKQTPKTDTRTAADVKKQLLNKVGGSGKISKKQHLKSILFGLSMGTLVLFIFLFGFFNERFIAPFITPSRNVSSTPIIIDPDSTEVGDEPRIIIPKINVEVPVNYNAASIQEDDIQDALEDGVVHYPTTPKPGELGNSVIVGHSSNNLFNSGDYKFAFVLLRKLEPGDTFYVDREGKRYAYEVYDKRVVEPTDVSVLGPTDRTATMTLITCDPPGTILNRLVIVAEQISPDPEENQESEVDDQEQTPEVVPGDAPTLWQRFTDWF